MGTTAGIKRGWSVRRAGLAVVGAAGLGAAGMTAPGAAASPAAPCHGTQLTATMSHIFGSEGAGSTGYLLTLENHGSAPCRVGNHPRLLLLSASGATLPTHVSAFGRPATVVLAAGHTAGARLRFSPDIPGPGEPGRGPCEPRAHAVRVLLDAPGRGSLTGPVRPPTSVCEHGAIEEQPLELTRAT